MSSIADTFRDLLQGEAIALLDCYGVSLTQRDATQQDMTIIATIGFSSDCLRGSLGLAFDEHLLHTVTLTALGGQSLGQNLQSDWLGELSNQLLGRMKRVLLDYGVEISLSTPIVLRGMRLQVHHQGDSTGHVHLHAEEGSAWICFDLRHDADLTLTYAPPPVEEDLLDDGMALFF